MRITLFIFILTCTYESLSQEKKNHTTVKTHDNIFKRYGDFLRKDTVEHSVYILRSLSYRYSTRDAVMHSGRGGNCTVGFNLARLFTKKFVFGFTFEDKIFRGLWPAKFSKEFISDFNAGFQNNLSNQKDSLKAEAFRERLNATNGFRKRGTNYNSLGVVFSPFPHKWGGIMIGAKFSGVNLPVSGRKKIFNFPDDSLNKFYMNSRYDFELTFKPGLFFSKGNSSITSVENFPFQISLFYQLTSFQNASYDNLPLRYFTSSAFMDKYSRRQHHIGITLRLGVY